MVGMIDHVDSLALSESIHTYHYNNQLITLHIAYKNFYLIASNKNNTYDYTGVRIWPGAELLCEWLITQPSLQYTSIIELGSGVGLCGLLCSKLSHSSITLTDCNTQSIELLQHNIKLNNCQHNTNVIDLLWSTNNTVNALYSAPAYDLIIASDVIYPDTTNETMCELFDTIDVILRQQDDTSNQYNQCAIMSYYTRSHITTQLLFDTAAQYHYQCTILHSDTTSGDYGCVLQFSKQSSDTVQDWHTSTPFMEMCNNSQQLELQDELYGNDSLSHILTSQYQFDWID